MEITDYTNRVYNLVKNLKTKIKDKDLEFSDIVDKEGNQYVDLVLEGGGVLGIALVGYTYVLEKVGIRFLQIGGTSAGAINALLLAALGTPQEVKSTKILAELAKVNMRDFVDGDNDSKKFIDTWLEDGYSLFNPDDKNTITSNFKRPMEMINIISKSAQVIDNIIYDLGLNPGKVFQKWIEDILRSNGIERTNQLLDTINQLPESLVHRKNKTIDVKSGLALVAADVSTQTKAIFPKMADLYWSEPNKVNPSNFVRASMSIPGFFHPFEVKGIPKGEDAMDRWGKIGFEKEPPENCIFIDGGIMSNFPINLFHKPHKIPYAPTFGVKLGEDVQRTDNINSPFKLAGLIFESARLSLDKDFIERNPDYQKLVAYIDTSDHNWIDFNLSDEAKLDLFERGAKAAADFLETFDWTEYKNIRGEIANAIKESKTSKEIMLGSAVQNGI